MLFLLRPRQTWMPYALPRGREDRAYRNEQLHKAYAATRRLPERSPSTTPDIVGALKELARLHDDGMLTDDEYASAKAKILEQ
jgi:hypothetical protein